MENIEILKEEIKELKIHKEILIEENNKLKSVIEKLKLLIREV